MSKKNETENAQRLNNLDAPYINQVKLRGIVNRKHREGDKWLVLGLTVSSQSGSKDYISVFFTGNNVDIVDKAYDVNSRVDITGKITTNKNAKSQSIMGLDINDTKRELEEKMGIPGVGRYPDDENEILIKGDFLKVYTPPRANDNFCIVTVHIKDGPRTFYPQFIVFGHQKEKALEFEKGTPICIVAHSQSAARITDGRRKTTESLVAHYIAEATE